MQITGQFSAENKYKIRLNDAEGTFQGIEKNSKQQI